MFFKKRQLYIITECLGLSLYDAYIKNNVVVPVKQIQLILKDVLKSLAFLKKCGIIHCDLKPENILLKADGSKGVKVIDFGSATFIDDVDYDYLQTRPYRAPEVTLGGKFDFAVDMWSVGCILFELITNKVLFNYSTVQENMAKALAINRQASFDYLDESKKRKYIINSNLLYISKEAKRNAAEELEIVVPKCDFDLALELKKSFCDLSLIDFVQKCLIIDPTARMTVEEAFEHEMIKRPLN